MAIKTQIQFRKVVLGAKHKDKKVFQMSSNGKIFNCEILINNLKEIIRQSNEDSIKVNELENPQISRIGEKLVSPEIILQQKEKYKAMARKEEEKAGGKRKGDDQNSGKRRTLKKKDGQENDRLPTIVVPVDLVGKCVTHHCFDNDESELDWFEGIVVGINEMNSNDPDLYIRYNGYDSVYLFSYHEFKDGNVKLLPVTVQDFLGKKISQRFEDEAQKHSWWENGKVISVVNDNDKINPEFVIEFDCQPGLDDEDDEPSVECEVCTFNLFEDYLNNDLHLL